MKRILAFTLTLVICAGLGFIPSRAEAHRQYTTDPVGDQRGSRKGDLDYAYVNDGPIRYLKKGERMFEFAAGKPFPVTRGDWTSYRFILRQRDRTRIVEIGSGPHRHRCTIRTHLKVLAHGCRISAVSSSDQTGKGAQSIFADILSSRLGIIPHRRFTWRAKIFYYGGGFGDQTPWVVHKAV